MIRIAYKSGYRLARGLVKSPDEEGSMLTLILCRAHADGRYHSLFVA